MNLKDFLDEAFVRGKKVKEEVLAEVIQSKTLNQMFSNDVFVNAVTKVIKTKEDVSRVLRKNFHNMFEMMDIPTRNDLQRLENKLEHLEKSLDRATKRTVSLKSKHLKK